MVRRPVTRNTFANNSRRTSGNRLAQLRGLFGTVLVGALGVAVLAACVARDGGGSGNGSEPSAPPASDAPESTEAPDPEADEKLLEAAEQGDSDGVSSALDGGADLETRDAKGRTPLLLAANGDHVEAARVLVEAGADPDAQDERDDSAWLVTGVTGSVEMARVLLPAEPDLTLTNRFGGISIIPASERGHVAYVREVLRTTDIDVDHVNDLGWTALLEAVILGDGGEAHQEIVELLLDAGASPDIADNEGVTPLQHAEQSGYEEIVRLLRAA